MPVCKGVHVCLKRVHACLERGSCLSGKGFMPVWKGVHVCLERGSCLSGKGFMCVWKGVHACLYRNNLEDNTVNEVKSHGLRKSDLDSHESVFFNNVINIFICILSGKGFQLWLEW